MKMANKPLEKVQKIVVFFDFCSSTTILEDLLRSESEKCWRDLLIEFKNFLREKRNNNNFDIYKFTGDGWILIFNSDYDSLKLFGLLKSLCVKYEKLFKKKIKPVLSVDVGSTGITFGIDKGTLVQLIMNGKKEYIGRPLNVAARLQIAIRDKDPQPQGKVLMSRSAYAAMQKALKKKYKMKAYKKVIVTDFTSHVTDINNIPGLQNKYYKTIRKDLADNIAESIEGSAFDKVVRISEKIDPKDIEAIKKLPADVVLMGNIKEMKAPMVGEGKYAALAAIQVEYKLIDIKTGEEVLKVIHRSTTDKQKVAEGQITVLFPLLNKAKDMPQN